MRLFHYLNGFPPFQNAMTISREVFPHLTAAAARPKNRTEGKIHR